MMGNVFRKLRFNTRQKESFMFEAFFIIAYVSIGLICYGIIGWTEGRYDPRFSPSVRVVEAFVLGAFFVMAWPITFPISYAIMRMEYKSQGEIVPRRKFSFSKRYFRWTMYLNPFYLGFKLGRRIRVKQSSQD